MQPQLSLKQRFSPIRLFPVNATIPPLALRIQRKCDHHRNEQDQRGQNAYAAKRKGKMEGE
jgi:hypothetical protein